MRDQNIAFAGRNRKPRKHFFYRLMIAVAALFPVCVYHGRLYKGEQVDVHRPIFITQAVAVDLALIAAGNINSLLLQDSARII